MLVGKLTQEATGRLLGLLVHLSFLAVEGRASTAGMWKCMRDGRSDPVRLFPNETEKVNSWIKRLKTSHAATMDVALRRKHRRKPLPPTMVSVTCQSDAFSTFREPTKPNQAKKQATAGAGGYVVERIWSVQFSGALLRAPISGLELLAFWLHSIFNEEVTTASDRVTHFVDNVNAFLALTRESAGAPFMQWLYAQIRQHPVFKALAPKLLVGQRWGVWLLLADAASRGYGEVIDTVRARTGISIKWLPPNKEVDVTVRRAENAYARIEVAEGLPGQIKSLPARATSAESESKVAPPVAMSTPQICVGNFNKDKSGHLPHIAGFTNVRVDRLTDMGNPFLMDDESPDQASRNAACNAFDELLAALPTADPIAIAARHGLRLHDRFRKGTSALVAALDQLAARLQKGESLRLLCWCKPKRCHGDGLAAALHSRLGDGKVTIVQHPTDDWYDNAQPYRIQTQQSQIRPPSQSPPPSNPPSAPNSEGEEEEEEDEESDASPPANTLETLAEAHEAASHYFDQWMPQPEALVHGSLRDGVLTMQQLATRNDKLTESFVAAQMEQIELEFAGEPAEIDLDLVFDVHDGWPTFYQAEHLWCVFRYRLGKGHAYNTYTCKCRAGAHAVRYPFYFTGRKCPHCSPMEKPVPQELHRAYIAALADQDPEPSQQGYLPRSRLFTIEIGGLTLSQMIERDDIALRQYLQHRVLHGELLNVDTALDKYDGWPTFEQAEEMWITLRFRMGRGCLYTECDCTCGNTYMFFYVGNCPRCDGQAEQVQAPPEWPDSPSFPSPPASPPHPEDGESYGPHAHDAQPAPTIQGHVPPQNAAEFQERFITRWTAQEEWVDKIPQPCDNVWQAVVAGITYSEMLQRSLQAEQIYNTQELQSGEGGNVYSYEYLGAWPTFAAAAAMWSNLRFRMGRSRFYVDHSCEHCDRNFSFYFTGPCNYCQRLPEEEPPVIWDLTTPPSAPAAHPPPDCPPSPPQTVTGAEGGSLMLQPSDEPPLTPPAPPVGVTPIAATAQASEPSTGSPISWTSADFDSSSSVVSTPESGVTHASNHSGTESNNATALTTQEHSTKSTPPTKATCFADLPDEHLSSIVIACGTAFTIEASTWHITGVNRLKRANWPIYDFYTQHTQGACWWLATLHAPEHSQRMAVARATLALAGANNELRNAMRRIMLLAPSITVVRNKHRSQATCIGSDNIAPTMLTNRTTCICPALTCHEQALLPSSNYCASCMPVSCGCECLCQCNCQHSEHMWTHGQCFECQANDSGVATPPRPRVPNVEPELPFTSTANTAERSHDVPDDGAAGSHVISELSTNDNEEHVEDAQAGPTRYQQARDLSSAHGAHMHNLADESLLAIAYAHGPSHAIEDSPWHANAIRELQKELEQDDDGSDDDHANQNAYGLTQSNIAGNWWLAKLTNELGHGDRVDVAKATLALAGVNRELRDAMRRLLMLAPSMMILRNKDKPKIEQTVHEQVTSPQQRRLPLRTLGSELLRLGRAAHRRTVQGPMDTAYQ